MAKKVAETSSHVPEFVKDHNVTCFLGDPPKGHEEFKSMTVGLNTCRIGHALRENPVVREDWIKEFWRNAVAKRTDSVIRSKIQNKEILISEQVIRDVLLFGDVANDPIEYSREEILPILERMSYEGTYPPTLKKLLHPYWRFLAHVYLVCISGNKSGIDSLTIKQTSAMVALVMNWKFNYSRCVFEDMLCNTKNINKQYWLKFPRFLQMILDAKYPSLEKTVDTYDTKKMNHTVFGLLKQKRKDARVMYQDRRPLEKFGVFSEIVEEALVPPPQVNVVVADEHDIKIQDAPVNEVEMTKSIDLTVDDDETVLAIVSEPPEDPTTSLHPRKRSRRDPKISLGMTTTFETSFIVSANETPTIKVPVSMEPQPILTEATVVTASVSQVLSEPLPSSMVPIAPVHQSAGEGSSSFQFDFDAFNVAQVAYLSEKAQGKRVETGVFIQEKHASNVNDDDDNIGEFGDVDIHQLQQRVIVLEQDKIFKEIQIASLRKEVTHKNKKIQKLETNLGSLSTIVLDLKQKLENKFGNEFAEAEKELNEAEREQQKNDRQEGMRKYMEDQLARGANQKKRRKRL